MYISFEKYASKKIGRALALPIFSGNGMKTKKLVSAEDVGAEVIRLSGIYIHNLGILVGAKAVIPLQVKN